jgi:ATP-dependent RNA helicase DeaD
MVTFRVEVGSTHGAKPGNLMGAIANESGLEARHIGRIEIDEEFSRVELPAGIPARLLQHLKGVRVAGRMLRIREDHAMPPGKPRGAASPASARPARFGANDGARPPRAPAAPARKKRP